MERKICFPGIKDSIDENINLWNLLENIRDDLLQVQLCLHRIFY